MSGISRTLAIFSIDPASAIRFRRWIMIGAKLTFWPLALLTLAMLTIQFGAWRKEFNIAGPFAAETDPARHSLILTVPKEGRTAWWRRPPLGETNGNPPIESRIAHRRPRGGASAYPARNDPGRVDRRFQPLGSVCHLLTPARGKKFSRDDSNASIQRTASRLGDLHVDDFERTARLASIRPDADIACETSAPTRTICTTLCRTSDRNHRRRALSHAVCVLLPRPTRFGGVRRLQLLRLGEGLGAANHSAHSLVANRLLGCQERTLSWISITDVAGFGTIGAWLGSLGLQDRRAIESYEGLLRSFVLWCSLPIAACAFIFCISAMWAGMTRPGDFDYANIGGLVPFSDARAYLAAAHDQARDGIWIPFAQRRPLASAIRSVLLFFSCYSLPIMLICRHVCWPPPPALLRMR